MIHDRNGGDPLLDSGNPFQRATGEQRLAHTEAFLKDLAIIMMVAGVITLLFHRFKQPVVLGYILAGLIVGPHTPPYPLITNRDTIQTLAELGVVFLLFSLGLEFSLRRLKQVGATVAAAAVVEIAIMLSLGYAVGRGLGWAQMDSLFLAAMLAIASTTIIVKVLEELGLKRERFAELIFGMLIVEDILAIAIIALLSGLAMTGEVSVGGVLGTLGRLGIFLVSALLAGLLLVPRLLALVARYQSQEMLLVSVLGLCFGFCLLVVQLGYSMALGAFVMGAVMAESRQIKQIERLIEPLRDMFSAIFFVAIGMLVDPAVLREYWQPILLFTAVVMCGKVLSCTFGALVAGTEGRTALKVGMGMAQIGEFSFIIATLGLTLGVTSAFLYPVVVAVSVLTTLFTPFLIRAADPLANLFERILPASWGQALRAYGDWLGAIGPSAEQAQMAAIVRRIVVHVLLNFCVIAGIFLGGAYLARQADPEEWRLMLSPEWRSTAFWTLTLVAALPFMVAAYRKLEALAMILAELSAGGPATTPQGVHLRRLFSRALPTLSLLAMLFLISALGSVILPPFHLFVAVLALVVLLALAVWPRVVRWHSQVQIALRETFAKDKGGDVH